MTTKWKKLSEQCRLSLSDCPVNFLLPEVIYCLTTAVFSMLERCFTA